LNGERTFFYIKQASLNKCASFVRLQTLTLELDLKDEKIGSLSQELEDMNLGGASDEEVSSLKRQKHDLELKLKDQVDTDWAQRYD
jgi:hypothetical protein